MVNVQYHIRGGSSVEVVWVISLWPSLSQGVSDSSPHGRLVVTNPIGLCKRLQWHSAIKLIDFSEVY